MDVYLIEKDTYERMLILDEYKSFIWTERMSSYGDFEMTMTPSKRWDNIHIGRFIGHSDSRALMMIEEKYESIDSAGEAILTVRGRDLTALALSRSVIPWNGRDVWLYTGTTGEAIYYLFRNFMMLENALDYGGDVIPDAYIANGTDDTEVISFAVGIKSLYDAVKELADTKNFSFGADLRMTSPRLRFYVEEGVERNITFSTLLDTLTEPSYLHSRLDYYNTAYIWSKDGKHRTSVGIPNHLRTGFDRKVLPVHASDLDVADDITTTQLIALMRQRGLEELAKHKEVRAFDAKLTGLDPYVYRAHYALGDIVRLMDRNGRQEKVRVTEYIFTHDANGYRAYPTFSTL